MLKRIRVAVVVLSLFTLVGQVLAQGDGELTEVNFLLNWTIVGDHAPYYVALENGWYEEAGLDVNIILGQGWPGAADT